MSEKETSEPANRRAYLREEDELLLRLRGLDEAEYRTILDGLARWRLDYRLRLADDIPHRPRDLQLELEALHESQPELVEYVHGLEREIRRLTRELDTERCRRQRATAVRVNLSAQGMRCRTGEALAVDDRVEIGLILMPDEALAVAIGRIIRVEPEDEEGMRTVSINFDHIHDSDQDVLVRHVYRLHRESLAQRRRAA